MNWRIEAKALEISMYRRKKVDVIADIEAKKTKPEFIRVIVSPKQATELCNKAIKEYVIEQGLCEPITCEKWFVNCKRKGIVYKGKEIKENENAGIEPGNGEDTGSSEVS